MTGCYTCGGGMGKHDPVAHDQVPENNEQPWHCICGSGDEAEWHSLMCVASNTPDDYWYSVTPTPPPADRN